jgi:phage major head subunit gpT-like protein
MAVKSMGLNAYGLKSAFHASFEQSHKMIARWPNLCTTIQSGNDSETYKWLGSVPSPRVWGTGRKARGLGKETYVVANEKYESTLEVDKDEVADDQTGQIRLRVQELGRRAATFKDYQLAQLLINGESSGFNSYDGVSFFDAAHVSGKSGSQDNQLAFDLSTYDSTASDTPNSPVASTCRQAFSYALSVLMGFKDDYGEIEDYGLDGLVVICTPQNWFTWVAAMQAGLLGQQGTSGGDTNILPVTAEVIAFPWLTDHSKFYLLRTGGVIRPFIFQNREEMTFASLAEGSEEDFHREKWYFGVRGRYKLTYGEWRHAVVVDMS